MPAPYRSGATNPVTEDTIYSDLDLAFIVHPVTRRPRVLTNNDSVLQGVRSAVLLNRYESLYGPDLGDIVQERLFESFNNPDSNDAYGIIENAIRNREPRAELLDVEITDDSDQNRLGIRITVRARGLNEQQVVDVTLNRVR